MTEEKCWRWSCGGVLKAAKPNLQINHVTVRDSLIAELLGQIPNSVSLLQ